MTARPMRGTIALALLLPLLAACQTTVSDKEDPLAQTAIDEAGLSSLYLSANDPREAIGYFETRVREEPNRVDFRRGLAISYARSRRWPESARVYEEMVALDQASPLDRLEYGFVIMRLGRWEDARELEAGLPNGLNTARRHQFTAMMADRSKDWDTADLAYERAERLSTNPARILNNWGVSKMSRGDLEGASNTFQRAVGYDSKLFAPKNNLAIVRAMAGEYTLPLVPMTDIEKAQMLNNVGMIALRQGKEKLAKGLFAAAVDTHPRHYAKAAQRLASIEGKVGN